MKKERKMRYADKPWLKSYQIGPYKNIKHSLKPYPQKPLFKILDEAAEAHPNQKAYLYLGQEVKYSELKLWVDKLATALNNLGLKKSDRVMVFLPNCPQFIISDFAVLKIGAVVVPCALNEQVPELKRQAVESEARAIICLDGFLELVKKIKKDTKIEYIIVTSITDYSPEESEPQEIKGTHNFRRLIANAVANPPVVEINPMEDLAILTFTGGTTGFPKGVMTTHFQRMSNILQGLPWMMSPLPGFKGKASILVAVPIFHALGHWVVQSGINWGLRIILIPDPRDIPMIAKLMNEFRPFMVIAVPEQLRRLIDPKINPTGLQRLQTMIISGSAELPEKIAADLEAKIGMPVSEGYGLTETSPCVTFNISCFSKLTGFLPKKKSGIGVPLPDTEIKLINPETGEEVPFGEIGEIWVKGPQVMKGYWPTCGKGLTEDGWLKTGDLAEMDEDGYFYIVGRDKDMINKKGEKIYPLIVERTLAEHEAVAMAVTIGVPDLEKPGSEKIKVFVRIKSAFKGKVSEWELIEFCQDKLPRHAIPDFIEFRDKFPLTKVEKISRKELREEEIKKLKEGN